MTTPCPVCGNRVEEDALCGCPSAKCIRCHRSFDVERGYGEPAREAADGPA